MATVITDGITQSPSEKKYVVILSDHYDDNINPHGTILQFSSGIVIKEMFSGLNCNIANQVILYGDMLVSGILANKVNVQDLINENGYVYSYHSGLKGSIGIYNELVTKDIKLQYSSGLSNLYASGVYFGGTTIISTSDGLFNGLDLEEKAADMTNHMLSGVGTNPHNVTAEQVGGISICSGILDGNLNVESGVTIDEIDVSEFNDLKNGSVLLSNEKHRHDLYSGKYIEFLAPSYRHSYLSGIYQNQENIYNGEFNLSIVTGSGINTNFIRGFNLQSRGTVKQVDVSFNLQSNHDIEFFIGQEDSTTCKKYNPRTSTWSGLTNPAEKLDYIAWCGYYNGNVYAFDRAEVSPNNTLMLIYNMDGDSWSTVDLGATGHQPTTSKRTVSCYYMGNIFIFQGYYCWSYNIFSQTLYDKTSASTTYDIQSGPCHIYNGIIYVIGTDVSSYPYILPYDPATDTWGDAISCNLNTYVFRPGIGINEKIYIFGTLDDTGTKYVTYCYDINENTWTKLCTTQGTANGQQYRGGATYWDPQERIIHLIGGYYTSQHHWKYYVDTDTWVNVTTSLPTTYQYPSFSTRYDTLPQETSNAHIKLRDVNNFCVVNDIVYGYDYPNRMITKSYSSASGLSDGTWTANEKFSIELTITTNSGIKAEFGDVKIKY